MKNGIPKKIPNIPIEVIVFGLAICALLTVLAVKALQDDIFKLQTDVYSNKYVPKKRPCPCLDHGFTPEQVADEIAKASASAQINEWLNGPVKQNVEEVRENGNTTTNGNSGLYSSDI